MTQSHPFWRLSTPSAELLLTPCPGTKSLDLSHSLMQLKTAGAQGIISLMPLTEMQHHQVAQLPEECNKLELKWFHLPIEDDCAPKAPFAMAWEKHKSDILLLLKQGQSIAVHCKGGTGRTGLMACQLLLELGAPLEPSIQAIKALRPKALSLAVHQNYIQSLVKE